MEPGRALIHRLCGFFRVLRDNGFVVGLAEARDSIAVLRAIDLARPSDMRAGLKPLLATERRQFELFDRLFDAHWLGHGMRSVQQVQGTSGAAPVRRLDQAGAPSGVPGLVDRVERGGSGNPADGQGRRAGASDAASLARTDFRHLTDPAQLAQLNELVDRLALAMRRRLTRRLRQDRRGTRIDLRRTLRASVATGGEPMRLFRRRPPHRPLRPVILLDASGSMSQYSAIFLRFMQGLLRHMDTGEGYVFHTRLVALGPVLKERQDSRAAERLALLTEGWGGGTRIGDCLGLFAREHAPRALRGRSVLFVLSDGYDTGEPERLGRAMAALSRRARRIVWLNPLLGWNGYTPVAGGMAAALPHVDLFAPAHTLDSLAALEPYLMRV